MKKRSKILSAMAPLIIAMCVNSNGLNAEAKTVANDGIEIEYDEEGNLIITEELIDSLLEKEINKCEYVYDGNLDRLVNRIVKNSNIYLIDHPEYKHIIRSKEDVEVFKDVLKTIIDNSTNNINEDIHRFSSLKVVSGELDYGISGLYDDDNNVIIISEDMIEFMSFSESLPYNEVLKKIYLHEVDHVRQTVCPCREKDEYRDLRYSVYENFYLESSAESYLINNSISYEDGTYLYERNLEAEILLLGLLSNKDTSLYYNSLFDTNINDMINYCNLSRGEIVPFLNIIYNMDNLCFRSEYSEKLIGEEQDLYYIQNCMQKIGFNYKVKLLTMCINRLLDYNNVNEISLEENLVLYDNIKNILLGNFFDMDYSKELINSISLLDDSFIYYLSNKYQVTNEEIRKSEYVNIRIISTAMYELSKGLDITNESLKDVAEYYLYRYPVLNSIYKVVDEYYYNNSTTMYKEKYESLFRG